MNKKTRSLIQYMTLTPYSIWAAVFIVVPLVFVAYYAFTDQNFHFTFDNISRFFTATSQILLTISAVSLPPPLRSTTGSR